MTRDWVVFVERTGATSRARAGLCEYSCFGPRTDSTNLLIVKAPDFCDFVRGGFLLGGFFATSFWVRLIRGSEIMNNQPTDHVRTCLIAIHRWSVGVDRIKSVVGRR